jgi:hypothetical protein
MQPVFRLDAFLRDAGADHVGQAIDIDHVHIEGLFDFRAHGVGPGFGAKNADFERALPWIARPCARNSSRLDKAQDGVTTMVVALKSSINRTGYGVMPPTSARRSSPILAL